MRLEGEERDLRDLAMHFDGEALEVMEEDGAFWLGSSDFAALADPEGIQQRGRQLVGLAAGALHLEFGRFTPPRVTAAVLVDESGAKKHFVHLSSSIRLHGEINARVERSRSDGSVEVFEVVAPPVQTSEWVDLARNDADVDDVLAILGRETFGGTTSTTCLRSLRPTSERACSRTAGSRRLPSGASHRRRIADAPSAARHDMDTTGSFRRRGRCRARKRRPSCSVLSATGWRRRRRPSLHAKSSST